LIPEELGIAARAFPAANASDEQRSLAKSRFRAWALVGVFRRRPFDCNLDHASGRHRRRIAVAELIYSWLVQRAAEVNRPVDRKIATGSLGSAAPVRDFRMQPFTRDFVPVGGYHPRKTAVAELWFSRRGRRTFDSKVDRSFDQKTATGSFGSIW